MSSKSERRIYFVPFSADGVDNSEGLHAFIFSCIASIAINSYQVLIIISSTRE